MHNNKMSTNRSVVVARGMFSVIHTLDSLKRRFENHGFYVDTFNISNGKLSTEFFASHADLLKKYTSDEIVVKEMRKIIPRSPKLCTSESHHDMECLISFLSGHWKMPLNVVRNIVRQAPEWIMMWRMMSKGISGQHHAVDEFTSMYAPQHRDRIMLCIRPIGSSSDNITLRVYRRFDGDIHSVKFGRLVTPKILLDMVRNVLLSLTYFSMYDDMHHFDIKPSNILYRVTKDGTIETRLTDYDSLCKLDYVKSIHDTVVTITDRYCSPLYPKFHESFDAMKLTSPLAPQHLTMEDVNKSWNKLIKMHARNERAPTYCDQLNRVIMKHDLYSLGCTLAFFRIKNRSHAKIVSSFIEDMLMADEDITVPNLRIRFNDETKMAPPPTTIVTPPQKTKTKRTRIMTISDASDRLNELYIRLKVSKETTNESVII
jgi:hypothetical protein